MAHRIVLVDDSIADVLILRRCLEEVSAEFDIIVLKDGEQALRFIEEERRGTRPTPCVIVLDFMLPKYDGIEILSAIRFAPALSHISVMVLTGSSSPEMIRKIEELSATYMRKPATLEGYQGLAARIADL